MAQTGLSLQDKKQVKRILALVEEYDEQIAKIASLEQEHRESAASAMKQMCAREAETILRGMDVENINRDRLGIRVASLRADRRIRLYNGRLECELLHFPPISSKA